MAYYDSINSLFWGVCLFFKSVCMIFLSQKHTKVGVWVIFWVVWGFFLEVGRILP